LEQAHFIIDAYLVLILRLAASSDGYSLGLLRISLSRKPLFLFLRSQTSLFVRSGPGFPLNRLPWRFALKKPCADSGFSGPRQGRSRREDLTTEGGEA
jgi:hypothetical protein